MNVYVYVCVYTMYIHEYIYIYLPEGHRAELLGRWSTNGSSVDEKMSGHVRSSTARGRPKSLSVMLIQEVLTLLQKMKRQRLFTQDKQFSENSEQDMVESWIGNER